MASRLVAGVIRVAGKDRKSTIGLLGCHNQRRFVRNDDAAEGDDLLCCAAVFLTPSVGGTNCHDKLLDPSDTWLIDPPSKLLRTHYLASRIKQRDPDHPSLA
jgi:hypothetical protein